MSILNVPTFCVITGASRGIGRETAIQLAGKVGTESLFCLVARSQEALEETARVVKEKADEKVDVRCLPTDLSDEESVINLNRSIFCDIGDESRFGAAIIFHNAGSAGEVVDKYAREMKDIKFIQRYNMLNLSGPIVMTSEFLKVFGKPGSSVRNTVIQTTSQAATNPTKTGDLYCMCKAGRDMFFKVLALEEPDLRILSYEPGFVETKIFTDVNVTPDKDFREFTEYVATQDYYLKPERSVHGLIQTLEEDKYESGVVVNCYDVLGMTVDV